ncbi:hypothetical protein CWR48_11935 [Oceanobacillus arenosus]|uniref:Uncharacterized protein n=1 Tax=Oceanobacillus arenosus TaxID=1229153 RepID=A0A3D8PRT7_9BACI|nr:hypothetical protein [Oceanobacillus arenosus]RDW18287.1 hypothetical protein CWR48_11935 [Oceanobacillus arenosus]
MEEPNIPWLKHLADIEKHLEKNEKWFQHPEKKMHTFEKNATNWDKDFIEGINAIEGVMKELEKMMEE